MLHTLPNDFHLAQYMDSSVLLQIGQQTDIYKTPAFFMKKHDQIIAMAMSTKYLCFGIIQQNEVAFVCYIPLIKDLRLEKLFKPQQQNTQIIGFKLIYQNQELEIYFRNKKAVQLWIQKLSKQITQTGFHQQFRPIRKIGKGGFATVYEVKRAYDGKLFAVKAFSKSNAFSTPTSRATIENQIAILKLMNQQNLMNLYEVFQSSNSLYLVMQMYEGGDLVTLIRKNNAFFQSDQIKSFMMDLFKGLKFMEEQKIMHRDIKPENIMIRKVGTQRQLVIGDFGLASETQILKYLLQRCGTPGYVAPQIASFRPGDRLSAKCDIFSLGVIFHILLLRTHLFNGNNCDEVYRKNKNLQFDLNDAQYETIDSRALGLLKRMLHQNPNERISASEALEHQYFEENDYEKINESPITVGSPNKQIFARMNEDLPAICERLVFG